MLSRTSRLSLYLILSFFFQFFFYYYYLYFVFITSTILLTNIPNFFLYCKYLNCFVVKKYICYLYEKEKTCLFDFELNGKQRRREYIGTLDHICDPTRENQPNCPKNQICFFFFILWDIKVYISK